MCYVIGPVTGVEGDNRAAFEAARGRILLSGAFDEVRIPHDCIPAGTPWSEAMRISIGELIRSDAVAMLEGCEGSRGASLEARIAAELGIDARPVADWCDVGGPAAEGGKWYAVTEIDACRIGEVCPGFSAISKLIRAGRKVKFKAFASEEGARRYLETGCSYCVGHARGGFKAAARGTRVSS